MESKLHKSYEIREVTINLNRLEDTLPKMTRKRAREMKESRAEFDLLISTDSLSPINKNVNKRKVEIFHSTLRSSIGEKSINISTEKHIPLAKSPIHKDLKNELDLQDFPCLDTSKTYEISTSKKINETKKSSKDDLLSGYEVKQSQFPIETEDSSLLFTTESIIDSVVQNSQTSEILMNNKLDDPKRKTSDDVLSNIETKEFIFPREIGNSSKETVNVSDINLVQVSRENQKNDCIIPESDCSNDLPEDSKSDSCLHRDSSKETIRIDTNCKKANLNCSELDLHSKTNENKTSDKSSLISVPETSTQEFNPTKKRRFLIPESDSDDDLDPDYIPEMESQNSLVEDEKIVKALEPPSKKKKIQNSYESNNNSNTDLQVEFLKKLHVPTSEEGGKYYKKQSCCPYCPTIKLFWRLDRHLVQKHADQATVIKLENLPNKCKEKMDLLKKLRLHGNLRWNTDSIVNSSGKLLVTRRLSKRTKNDFVPFEQSRPLTCINDTSVNAKAIDEEIRQEMLNCNQNDVVDDSEESIETREIRTVKRIKCDKCPEFVSRRNISVHHRMYHASGEEKRTSMREILKNCNKSDNYVHPLACRKLREEIFPTMRGDNIFDIIKYDTMLILYLNEICEQYDVKDQNNLIKNHARGLGRYIHVMRKVGIHVTDLESCIKVKNWKPTVTAVREIGGFDTSTRIFSSPSTAQFCGLLLKNVIRLMKSHFNQTSNQEGLTGVIAFETEFASHWLTMIGSKIVSSQNLMKKRNEGKTIREMNSTDVNLLLEYLDQKRNIIYNKIQLTLTKKLYNELTALQMIYIQCSNGRRPGETARTLLSDYTSRMKHDTNNEFFKMLDVDEKKRTVKYSVMDTKGKKLHGLTGRVYLKKRDEKILDFLINHREAVNINKDNEFLYAPAPENSTSKLFHLDAHLEMKKIVDDCHDTYKKFSDRSTVTATGLRKFIATSYKNKTKGQYSKELMRHLAHDENTHDKAYRKVTAQETAKITAILEEIIIDAGKKTEKRTCETNERLPELPDNSEIPQKSQKHNDNDLVDLNNNDTEFEDEVENFKEKLQKTKTRQSWKRDDIDDFENAFQMEINKGVYPSRKKILDSMSKYPRLQKRGEGAIRAKFQNLKKRNLL